MSVGRFVESFKREFASCLVFCAFRNFVNKIVHKGRPVIVCDSKSTFSVLCDLSCILVSESDV